MNRAQPDPTTRFSSPHDPAPAARRSDPGLHQQDHEMSDGRVPQPGLRADADGGRIQGRITHAGALLLSVLAASIEVDLTVLVLERQGSEPIRQTLLARPDEAICSPGANRRASSAPDSSPIRSRKTTGEPVRLTRVNRERTLGKRFADAVSGNGGSTSAVSAARLTLERQGPQPGAATRGEEGSR